MTDQHDLQLPDDLTVQAEELRYALTQSQKTKMQHVTIPKKLLDQARETLQAKTHDSFPITNQTLVKYALVNLLDPLLQDRLRHRLQDYHTSSSLVKLLALKRDPSKTQLNKIDNALQDQQLATDKTEILLMALINAVGWLIYDRNGLDHLRIAKNSDELLAKLRQDDLKPYLDRILDAGLDEKERQQHYHKL